MTNIKTKKRREYMVQAVSPRLPSSVLPFLPSVSLLFWITPAGCKVDFHDTLE